MSGFFGQVSVTYNGAKSAQQAKKRMNQEWSQLVGGEERNPGNREIMPTARKRRDLLCGRD